MFNQYLTETFCEIFESYEDFKDVYDNDIPTVLKTYTFLPEGATQEETKSYVSDTTLEMTYYLLVANYANSNIKSTDLNRFKLKLFTTIFQYGPVWEKRMDLQKIIRSLTRDQMKAGTKAINNHVFNDGTAVSDPNNELANVNEQNTTSYRKSPVEAYSQIYQIVGEDVTRTYMDRFKDLFMNMYGPAKTVLFATDTSGEEE